MKPTQIIVKDDSSHSKALDAVNSIDIDAAKPVVVEVKPFVKKRSLPQNRLQWSGMIGDFVSQGWHEGKQFSAELWHNFLKRLHLPEQYEEGITLEGYVKWAELPNGELLLVGSTTQLTTLGMTQYMEKCYAFGAEEYQIRFTTVAYE